MEEKESEILKRKKIRKLLLLKINDELKEIAKYKSNIRINSKTIKELNEAYNKNDILLFEKSTVYYNYIKTEETIISNNASTINIIKEINRPVSKSVNKINSKNEEKNINININKNKEKSVNKNNIVNKFDKFEFNSIEEDSGSPIMSFFPKKIELGRKKFLDYKPKNRHNESIPNISKKNINLNKETVNEQKLNKSTKFSNNDINLYKLIEKITSIKNNESAEGIIKQNIKKLRNYCYQLRKKKKIKKVMSVNKNNNNNDSSRKKIKYKDKKFDRNPSKKRSSIINKDVVEKSLFLIKQKLEGNNNINKLNIRNDTSQSLSPHFNLKVRKKSTAKVIKLNQNYKYKINIIPPEKSQKNYSSLKNKEKAKKLKSVNELIENKFINKLIKKKKKKSLNNEEKTNITTEENIPSINQIPKNVMRSFVNENRIIFDNSIEDSDKNKSKFNKLKFNHKKSLNKNINLNIATNNNDNDNKFHYFNGFNNKKDKIELHDNLIQNKSSKKSRKYDQKKKEIALKNEESDEEIIKLKKLSIVIDSRKKSKKKIFDSPDRKVYRYSNFSNYRNRNIVNSSNKNTNDKMNKTFAKRNKLNKE